MISNYNNDATARSAGGAGGISSSIDDGVNAIANRMKTYNTSALSANAISNVTRDLTSSINANMPKITEYRSQIAKFNSNLQPRNFDFGSVGQFKKPKKSRGSKPGDILSALISLVTGIIKIPTRFDKLLNFSIYSMNTVAVGTTGALKSAGLAISDTFLILIAFARIIVKYWKCILSGIVTLPLCFIIHIFTFLSYVIYQVVEFIAELITPSTGLDIMPMVDNIFNQLKWPSPIYMMCYTCFGERRKMSDITRDLGMIQDLADKLDRDFNVRIPAYMRPAKPPATKAIANLNAAFA